jgi:hypothetical protein
MLIILILSATVSSILIVLLKTDVIYEYLSLLPLSKRQKFALLLKPYEMERGDYPNILFFWHEKFIIRPFLGFFLKIVTCPYCAGLWLTILLSLLFGIWEIIGAVYFFGLLGYFLIEKLTKTN